MLRERERKNSCEKKKVSEKRKKKNWTEVENEAHEIKYWSRENIWN